MPSNGCGLLGKSASIPVISAACSTGGLLALLSQRVSHHCLSLLRGRHYLGTPELPESQPFGFLLLLDPASERDGKGIQPSDPNSHKDHNPRRREHSEHDPHNQS